MQLQAWHAVLLVGMGSVPCRVSLRQLALELLLILGCMCVCIWVCLPVCMCMYVSLTQMMLAASRAQEVTQWTPPHRTCTHDLPGSSTGAGS